MSKAEAEQILKQAIEAIKTGGAGDRADELLAWLWKGFPSFSRHLDNKVTEEDQGMVITAAMKSRRLTA
jgi:hypothetical protein